MSVILNNPMLIILIVIGIGATIVLATKYFEEYGLNKQLHLKQRSMRIKGANLSSKKSLLGAAALAPAFLVVIGLFVAANINTPENGTFLKIESSDDIFDIYERFNGRSSGSWLRGEFFALEETADMETDAPTNDAGGEDDYSKGSGSDDYSETNNQVEGVDEYDNVVTDGKYIYTMNGGKIQVTLAFTQEYGIQGFGKLHEIEFNQEYVDCNSTYVSPIGMYADGERLVVIASEYFYYNWECYQEDDSKPYVDYWYGNDSNGIKVFVFEVETWDLEDEYTLNGYFVGTRKIGDDLYVITNKYLPLHDDSIDLDDFLPHYEVNEQIVKADYEDIVYNDGTNPNTFTTFYGIDLSTTEVDMEVVLGDSGYNLYVSENNMYLVGSVYYFWPESIIATDEEPVYEPKTAIMKVAIGDGNVEYKAIGYVDGYTLNQFSMDEYDGHLRITTTSGWWGSEINNRLFVLDQDLKVVGKLEGLGKPGETIRSTRFVGEYAYVVTFEQTDPFYVINVSDPTNPVKEGELEIPGFSTYLQPLGNDYMLGIGFDADEDTGWTTGIKIQIYDISDKANPTVFDTITFPYSDFDEFGWSWSWTSVTYNHKDLLLDLNKGIIAFPFSSNYYTEQGEYQYNSGILVYNIDLENGFSEDYSFVQHETDSEDYTYVYKAKFINDTNGTEDTSDDTLYFYTISNKYMTVHNLEDLSPEGELDRTDIYAEYTNYYWGYYEDTEEPAVD